MSFDRNDSLLQVFGLDSNLSIKNKEQVKRIREKIEKIIEIESKKSFFQSSELSNYTNKENLSNSNAKYEMKKEILLNEAKNCSVIFLLTSINYFFIRNNRIIFNNVYTDHIFRPSFFFTFLALPNFISFYFAKLNYDLNKDQ